MTSWREGTSRLACMATMRVLQDYLDRTLDDVASHRVAAHLEHCRRCGLEAAVYTEIKTALKKKDRSIDPDALERLRRFGEQLASREESDLGDPGA